MIKGEVFHMRFAVQENLVSGKSFAEKVNNIQVSGYEGIELNGGGLKERLKEIGEGLHNSGISATAICGGYKLNLYIRILKTGNNRGGK